MLHVLRLYCGKYWWHYFTLVSGDIDQKGGSSIFKVMYGEQAKLFEKEDVPKIKHTQKLTVSMVNDGKTSFLVYWIQLGIFMYELI